MSMPFDDPHQGFEDLFDDSMMPFSITEYRPAGEVAAAMEELEGTERASGGLQTVEVVRNVLAVVDHKLEGKPIRLEVDEAEIATLIPVAKDQAKMSQRIENAEKALSREVDGLFHMLAYSTKAKEELKTTLHQKLRWKERLKHNSKLKDICDSKLHISQLAYSCSSLQNMLLELVEEKAVVYTKHGFSINDTLQSTSLDRAPLLRPLSHDKKILRCDTRVFCKMKSLIFTSSDVRARLDVAASLEPEDFTNFLLNPYDTFTSVMRYAQINYAEFIDLMFFRDSQGDRVAPKCPCGRIIKVTPQLLVMHIEPCAFRKYLRSFSALCDDEGNVRRESNVVLSVREDEYLKRLLIRRLPQEKWESSGLSRVLVRYMNGRDPQVLKTIGPDSYELHRANCNARANCRVCNTDNRW